MMRDGDIEIIVHSDNRYDKLVLEIYYKDRFIALLSQDDGRERVKIELPAQELVVELSIFEQALAMAKEELLENET